MEEPVNKNTKIVFNIRSSRLNSIESESEPDETTEPQVNLSRESSCNLTSLDLYTQSLGDENHHKAPSTSDKQCMRSVAFRSYNATPVPYDISDITRFTSAECSARTKWGV